MSKATKVQGGVMAVRNGSVGGRRGASSAAADYALAGHGWGDCVYRFSADRREGAWCAAGPGPQALWGAVDSGTVSLPARRIGRCWRATRASRSVPIRREGRGVRPGLFLPLPIGRPDALHASSRRGREPANGGATRGDWDQGRWHTDVRKRPGWRAVARKRLDRLTAWKRPSR
jgi:hypothetical protein